MQLMSRAIRITSGVLACAIATLALGQDQPAPASAQPGQAQTKQTSPGAQQPPAPAQQPPAPMHEAMAPTQQAALTTQQGKSLAASAGLLAYPTKSQTPERQTKDEAECYNWAKQQSGFDPMAASGMPVQAQATQPEQTTHTGRVKGTAGGAAAGAAIGAVAGNAGKGAAIGATAGLLASGREARRKQEQSTQQAQANAAQADAARAAQQQLADKFKRGMAVCLESRGYAVK